MMRRALAFLAAPLGALVVVVAVVVSRRGRERCGMKRVAASALGTWRSPPSEPQIVEDFAANRGEFAEATRRERLLARYGEEVVALTSSNSYSEHEASCRLEEYLSREASGRSNESLYLFGPNDWLLEPYATPRCGGSWCAADAVTASFGVARARSGVSFHSHGSGFAEVVHGAKRWLFYRTAPDFDPDLDTQTFVDAVLPTLRRRPDFDCELRPGQLLFFPKDWWHATLNLADYNVFVSTFVADAGDGHPPGASRLLFPA